MTATRLFFMRSGMAIGRAYRDSGATERRSFERVSFVNRTKRTKSVNHRGSLNSWPSQPNPLIPGAPMPYATARWIDQNNRSHTWSGEVASHDREQIKTQIRSQTGAKEVIIQSVRG